MVLVGGGMWSGGGCGGKSRVVCGARGRWLVCGSCRGWGHGRLVCGLFVSGCTVRTPWVMVWCSVWIVHVV